MGTQALHAGDYALALEFFDRSLTYEPGVPLLHFHRANAMYLLRRFAEAVESYGKAIALRRDFAEAFNNRASALSAIGRLGEALADLDEVLRLAPDYGDAHVKRAQVLYALARYAEGVASAETAVALNPASPEGWMICGNLLHILQRYQAAADAYTRVVELSPQLAEAYNNRGVCLLATLQQEAARSNFEQAVALNPAYVDAHRNLGYALQALKLYQPALATFDTAVGLGAQDDYLPGARLQLKRVLCQWDNSDLEVKQVETAIHRGEHAALPFSMLPISDDPAVHRRAAEIYVADRCPGRAATVRRPPQQRPERIRIGYYSADYFDHATSYLMAELLERHDRSRFEIIGFSFGANSGTMGQRVAAAFDRFLDVQGQTDAEIARLSAELEIDIAVDLKGFTREGRPGIFSCRAAPLQVSYLGYPGTMGAAYIDYLIADPIVVPRVERAHYSEKIVYLPDSYQVNDSRRPLPGAPGTRAAAGLPEAAFVYCCFNTLHKITPQVFASWMRILSRVPESVLWLLEDNPWAAENLRREAGVHGIDPQRLVFAQPAAVEMHLSRHQLADLFLDTSPYNAHTTASDALWAGLPLLTRAGRSFAARVAASLLHAVGLDQLVTNSQQEYEDLAVALANDPARVDSFREHLQRVRTTATLFDTAGFTAHIEDAYVHMYERWFNRLPPDDIRVQARPSSPVAPTP